MTRGRVVALWLLLALGVVAATPYAPNRFDYSEFLAGHPTLLEPNYLPFLTWRVEAPPKDRMQAWLRELPDWLGGSRGAELLVFCHWEPGDFPLPVYVQPPELRDDEEELRPPPPGAFVAAALRALAIWSRDLDGVVTFRRVDDPAEARLRIALLRAPAAERADVAVLGTARVGGGCEAVRGDPASGRVETRFEVSELRVHIADEHGLLLPDQVEKVALHEIGHALGMPAHSPIPADLMFPIARDRISRDGLGAQDVNSFLSLYALPNGTVYRDLSQESDREPPARVPEGAPRLALAPHVDARLGFEVQMPRGWTRISTPYGVVAVDGVSWDFESSLQVIVRRHHRLAEYLERHGPRHMADSRIRKLSDQQVAGRPAKNMVLETRRDTVEELSFIESGDGRVLVMIAEAPADTYDAWAPWFLAVRDSLEIIEAGPGDDRDYRDR